MRSQIARNSSARCLFTLSWPSSVALLSLMQNDLRCDPSPAIRQIKHLSLLSHLADE